MYWQMKWPKFFDGCMAPARSHSTTEYSYRGIPTAVTIQNFTKKFFLRNRAARNQSWGIARIGYLVSTVPQWLSAYRTYSIMSKWKWVTLSVEKRFASSSIFAKCRGRQGRNQQGGFSHLTIIPSISALWSSSVGGFNICGCTQRNLSRTRVTEPQKMRCCPGTPPWAF